MLNLRRGARRLQECQTQTTPTAALFKLNRSICCPLFHRFFFSFLSAKAFSTLFHSSASRKSVVFSAPHSDTVVLLAGPNRMKCYAFFFFPLPQHWFYSKGELTSWFGPGLDFLNNLSPPLLYTWHTDSLPIYRLREVSFLICFKMNTFYSKMRHRKLPLMKFMVKTDQYLWCTQLFKFTNAFTAF